MEDGSSGLSKTKKAYFKAAEAMSLLSDHRTKLGCVVVKNHKIISSGHNSWTKTHPFQAKIDKKFFGCECAGKLHAETDALLPLIKNGIDLTDASIYVIRKMNDGSNGMARPCPRCMSIIKKCGIKNINYTTGDGFAHEVVEVR